MFQTNTSEILKADYGLRMNPRNILFLIIGHVWTNNTANHCTFVYPVF